MNYKIYFAVIIICFLSFQRFLLEDLYSYMFLLIYPIVLLEKNINNQYTLLFLSLFLINDNGGGFYNEPITFFRYLGFFVPLIFIFYHSKFKLANNLWYSSAIICFYIILTLFNTETFDYDTLKRSTQILFFIVLYVINSKFFRLNYLLLSYAIVAVLFAEILNYFLFNNVYYGEYLTYHSLKSLILIPFIFFLHYVRQSKYAIRNILNFIILSTVFLFTLIITFEYQQRMMLLCIFFIVTIFLLKNFKIWHLIIISMLVLLLPQFISDNFDYLILNKSTALLLLLVSELPLNELIFLTDPVRYTEFSLFFGRDLFSILFGDGLAAGLVDSIGEMGFVDYDDTAFSQQELDQSVYYNLHETIIDTGLRFGLIPVLFIFIKIVFDMFKRDPIKNSLLFILFMCSFWTINGILAFFMVYQSKNYDSSLRPNLY